MKAKVLLWFLFVGVISPPLYTQQNQKLDSILEHYPLHEAYQMLANGRFRVVAFYFK